MLAAGSLRLGALSALKILLAPFDFEGRKDALLAEEARSLFQ